MMNKAYVLFKNFHRRTDEAPYGVMVFGTALDDSITVIDKCVTLVGNRLGELSLSCMQMWFQRRPESFVYFAQEKLALAQKAAFQGKFFSQNYQQLHVPGR